MNAYKPKETGKLSPNHVAKRKFVTIWTGWDKNTTRRYEEIWVDCVMVLKIENVAAVDYRQRNSTDANPGA